MMQDQQDLSGRLYLRYEDVDQEGRLMLGALPVALGVLWRGVDMPKAAAAKMRADGVLPILTRMELEAGPGPFALHRPLQIAGGYHLAHAVDESGNVSRILLDMYATLVGIKDRTNLPPPEDAGSEAVAGKLRVEHVFTKPFAAPNERKVSSLDDGERSFVPSAQRPFLSPQSILVPPANARAIDSEPVEDPVRLAMGLMHTDSNHHVNSLVYPRLFEEAALRRVASSKRSTAALLARSLVIGFRRPSFSGEALRAFVRLYEDDTGLLATGFFFGADDDVRDPTRARVFIRLAFSASAS